MVGADPKAPYVVAIDLLPLQSTQRNIGLLILGGGILSVEKVVLHWILDTRKVFPKAPCKLPDMHLDNNFT